MTTTEPTPEAVEIKTHFDSLFRTRHRLLSAGIRPTAVMLPGRLNDPYDGPDATDAQATLFGLPIAWADGEHWGLVVGERP